MTDGYSFSWDWTITKNDAGCKVDFTHPSPDVSLYDWIDKCLEDKLNGIELFCDTRSSPDIAMDKDIRERLIIKWGAFFDAEFASRNAPIFNKPKWNYGLNFDSPFNQVDGYGNAGEQIVKAFLDRGIDIRIGDHWKVQNDKTNLDPRVLQTMQRGFNETKYSIGIRFSQPNSFQSTPGKFKIGWSMWEFPVFPSSWRDGCNNVNINFVPCGWNRLLWEQGNVIVPTITIPLGIPENSFPFIDRDLKTNPFTFIADGSILGESQLVEYFKKEFKGNKNVRLVLKTLPREKKETIINDNITEIRGRLTPQELLDWYRLGQCFVYPTPAEGFGLFPVEAMATGLPVIMTDLPAMKTFCREDICYPIRVAKVDWYHFPDNDDVIEKMIYIYEHREEAKEKGRKASQFIHSHLTYKQTVEKILRLIT